MNSELLYTILDYGVAFALGVVFIIFLYRVLKWVNDRTKEVTGLIDNMLKADERRIGFRETQEQNHERHNERMAELLRTNTEWLEDMSSAMTSVVSVLDNIHSDTKDLPAGITEIANISQRLTEIKNALDDSAVLVRDLVRSYGDGKLELVQAINTAMEDLYARIAEDIQSFRKSTKELQAVNRDADAI